MTQMLKYETCHYDLISYIKCDDLNRYTFSSMLSNEKVYLFKSAHFI